MINVRNMKIDPKNGFIPVTNIWCAGEAATALVNNVPMVVLRCAAA